MLNNIAAIVGGISAPVGDYESIATTTVGAGGTAGRKGVAFVPESCNQQTALIQLAYPPQMS
jgi:hypothetical protein